MVQVLCEVLPGLRATEKTVAVEDVFGRRQFLRVEEGFIATEGTRYLLPVGVVGVDEAKGMALIELPHESDAGVNRLWVRNTTLRGLRPNPRKLIERREKRKRWVQRGQYAVAVEIEVSYPDDDPSEACLEPAAVRWLDEVARRAGEGDLVYLRSVGRVFQAVET